VIVRASYVLHILAGSLGLVFGYIALFSAKGGTLHRRSGRLFVYAMLPMAIAGMTIAMVRGVAPAINLPAGLLTSYLVITSLTAIRPPASGARGLHVAALLVALGIAASSLTFAFQAVTNGGTRNGMPAFPFVLFGGVALIGFIGDVRVMRSGALRGVPRLARHLWRMSFALFIAALSFFIGQAKVIPEPIRIRPLLAAPVLVVLVTMFYWLWRIRRRRRGRGEDFTVGGTLSGSTAAAPVVTASR
jgi:uncharacterized membrane protein